MPVASITCAFEALSMSFVIFGETLACNNWRIAFSVRLWGGLAPTTYDCFFMEVFDMA